MWRRRTKGGAGWRWRTDEAESVRLGGSKLKRKTGPWSAGCCCCRSAEASWRFSGLVSEMRWRSWRGGRFSGHSLGCRYSSGTPATHRREVLVRGSLRAGCFPGEDCASWGCRKCPYLAHRGPATWPGGGASSPSPPSPVSRGWMP